MKKSIFSSLKRRRKVPLILQLNRSECGAACLAMVLGYHGRKTRVSECRPWCDGGRDGVRADSIAEAAEHFGLQVQAYTLSLDQLRHISLPAIIHWHFNHFVILEHWSRARTVILDPALGRRRISPEEFSAGFTGVVLTFQPGAGFSTRTKRSGSGWKYYLHNIFRLKSALRILLQILGASLILQVLGLVLPVFTKILVDHVLVLNMHELLLMLGLGLLVLVLAHLVVSYMRGALLVYLQGRLDSGMMVDFLEHVLSLPYRFFQQRQSGDLLMRLRSNITIREIITNQTMSVLLDGFFVLVYLGIIISLAPLFALLVLILAALQIGILLGTTRRVHRLMQNNLAASAESRSYLLEILQGIASLKASGGEDRALKSWTNKFFKELNFSLERHHLSAVVDSALRSIQLASPLALLWVGGFMVLNGTLSLGTMLALQALGIEFLVPLSALVETGQQWQLVGAYLERNEDVIEAQPEQPQGRITRLSALEQGIELQDVAFGYDPQSQPVLQDISFEIRAGQKLALVGRTGAGKSTLALLLLGLYPPSRGQILYDRVSQSEFDLRSLRRQFGAVLQESFFTYGSIRQNIAFNNPGASMDEVVEAAKIAAVHEEIVKMPMGYETLLAEGGTGLSGGQRQRLSIARAIVHKPAILLLDEATSHLDALTEARVDQNLGALPGTRIVIAHRLSTIKNADLILVLEEGRIMERGGHDQLMAKDGFYKELIRTQILAKSFR